MSWHFHELFSKKLQKVPHSVEKHEKSSIWPKLCNFFEQTTMFWCLDELFSKRLQKVAQFAKKHEKSSIWPKLCNFSRKLPWLCISMNFWGKSCRKCLISWKSTKNHRFGQNLQLFEQTTVFAFRWTFQKKVAKSASFREKTRKINDLAKTCNFSRKLRCVGIFMNFSERNCKKVPHFVRKHGKSSIWPKLVTFRKNYHVFTFRWTLWQKVAKTASFRGKARKLIDLAKTMQLFRTNYHVLVFRLTFQQKVAKSCWNREKARKIIHLAKTMQLF